jgi:UDP-N-acetylmuramate dehydrogenase
MAVIEEILRLLAATPNLQVCAGAPLARYTRFGVGGPADVYAETASEEALIEALRLVRASGAALVVIGGGTNLIVSDAGFRGVVLRFTAAGIRGQPTRVEADAGAELDSVVKFAGKAGLAGIETLAGIPGSFGAAVYGNAGAYGHSLSEVVERVRFFDGSVVREFARDGCEFAYRESAFKRHKEWIVFSARLELAPGDAAALQAAAEEIRSVRDAKFPQSMRCAGSVFKNLLVTELPAGVAALVPPGVVREGKVPAAYFLEQAGAKGAARGDMRVADYHANLIYNAGAGTARDLVALIGELKARVRVHFHLELEEEVQYVGFENA